MLYNLYASDKFGNLLKSGDLITIDQSELRWVQTKKQDGWEIQFFRSYEIAVEVVAQHIETKEKAFFPTYAVEKQK